MKHVTGSIWQYANDGVIGIPTNGYLSRNGAGVMGRGLALQAKEKYPDIPYNLGRHLQRFGNTVGWILLYPIRIIAIPVKPSKMVYNAESDRCKIVDHAQSIYSISDTVPGYHCKATPEIICRSLYDLIKFMLDNDLNSVYIPLLGCGAGGLDYKKDLVPILTDADLPDSITLVHPYGELK